MQSAKEDFFKRLKYFECPKGDFHQDQILNIVCVEPGCQNKLLCCNVCISEDHKKHTTKSLKVFLSESKQQIQNVHKMKINIDIVMELIEQNRIKNLSQFKDIKESTLEMINNIEKQIQNYYRQIVAKVKVLTTTSVNEIMNEAFKEIYKKTSPLDLMRELQRIISYLPKDKNQQSAFNQEALIQNLKSNHQDIYSSLVKISSENKYLFQIFKNRCNANELFAEKRFRFSQNFKHQCIQLVNPTTARSTGSSSYKFCILQPSLEGSGKQTIKQYTFKIKENSSSNWIALGMCHKQKIVQNEYGFNYSNLGHGAYMISSNAGSWSNIQTENNNIVKSFYFYKNDIIFVKVDFTQLIIKFAKKGSQISYQLKFKRITEDPLFPCVLFYFENDEVEYIQSQSIDSE